MFTLKFKRFGPGIDTSTTYMTCYHFTVNDLGECKEITVYNGYTSQNGVTYKIMKDETIIPSWPVCYVENENGKTIDKIGF